MTTAKITAMLLVLALVSSASARVITVEVTGVVDGVGTHGGLALDGSVDIGSAITGFTTYDTDTPDLSDGSNGRYALISISMTVGNYTFTHDPISSTSALFEVRILSSNSYSYTVRSHDPRFDGTVYIDGSPKTFDEVNLDPFGLKLMKLVDPDSIITDELPDLDSWPDISTFTSERYFGVGVDSPPDAPGFAIWGELTSLTVIPESAMTYYVNATDGSDDNDGLSPQTAFATIQKAIDSAYNGDTVLVADGTYTGPGNRDIDFFGKAITVRSESGPENCIIDCEGTETDPHRGFYFHSSEDANSILEGFTITNGYSYGSSWLDRFGGGIYCDNSSPTINNCIISGNSARAGGGMGNDESNPTVINCTFSGNSAYAGGGIDNDRSSPTVTNCTFTKNSAEGHGGGMENRGRSSPTVTNCTFSGNSSSGFGGGMENDHLISPTITNCTFSGNSARWGGGVYNFGRSSPTLTNCTFSGNSASYYGGGMYNGHESNPTLTNCTFTSNSADRWGGGMYNNSGSPTVRNCTFSGNSADGHGGGMYNDYSIVTLINCIFSGNSADWGGGMYNRDSSPTLINCIFSGNSAEDGGGGMANHYYYDELSTILTNCIFWGNTAEMDGDQISLYSTDHPSMLTISYSDVQGGLAAVYIDPNCSVIWGLGNINADPCFVEPGYWDDNGTPDDTSDDFWIEGDYYLLPDSLCIDTGDPNYIPEPNETDLDGQPRIIGGRIDMGAYESNYIQAAMKLTPQMLNCNSKGKYIKAHLTLPEGFLPEDVDVNESAIAEPMGIDSESIKVLGSGKSLVKLEICFDREAFCETITETGEVEITVIGSLTAGRYFYATDTIKIKP